MFRINHMSNVTHTYSILRMMDEQIVQHNFVITQFSTLYEITSCIFLILFLRGTCPKKMRWNLHEDSEVYYCCIFSTVMSSLILSESL